MRKVGQIRLDLRPRPAQPPHPGRPERSQEQVPVPTPAWRPGGLSPGQTQGPGKALRVDTSVWGSVSQDSAPYIPPGGKYEIPLLLLRWADSRAPGGQTPSPDALPHSLLPPWSSGARAPGQPRSRQTGLAGEARGLRVAQEGSTVGPRPPFLPLHLRKKHTRQTLQTVGGAMASSPLPVPCPSRFRSCVESGYR